MPPYGGCFLKSLPVRYLSRIMLLLHFLRESYIDLIKVIDGDVCCQSHFTNEYF